MIRPQLFFTTTALLLFSLIFLMDKEFISNHKHSFRRMLLRRELSELSDPKTVLHKESKETRESGGSAFCLIVKDENDILLEWVAYHYHVFKMRRLIVATDPSSKNSPLDVLNRWIQNNDYFGLDVTVWNDEDFMPDYFNATDDSKMDYSRVPLIIPTDESMFFGPSDRIYADKLLEPIRKGIIPHGQHENETYVRENQEQVRKELMTLNNHRFRQQTFISQCFRQIKTEQEERQHDPEPNQIGWTVHIDTDEYLVPNPWISLFVHNNESAAVDFDIRNENDNIASQHFDRKVLGDIFPEKPSDGSLWKFFHEFFEKSKTGSINRTIRDRARTCVTMPRVDFGAKEDADNATPVATTEANKFSWNHKRFESLRWKYHGNFNISMLHGKTIVNTIELPNHFPFFSEKMAQNVHQPLPTVINTEKDGCSHIPMNIYNELRFEEPILVRHHLGSLERFLSLNYVTRNAIKHNIINEQASQQKGDELGKWWIGGWLDNFVALHGSEKAYAVLPEPYSTRQALMRK